MIVIVNKDLSKNNLMKQCSFLMPNRDNLNRNKPLK